LADTRGLQQDELHKRSIAKQIKEHIESITAVLVLANGTVPRVTVGTDYALSTLSAIFPKTLANNISFVFTNVSSPLHWNFSGDTIPDVLKDAPQFFLNNPIALQRKYLRLKDHPNMRKTKTDLRKAVKAGEENALEMLEELFDWLDGLEPQPTKVISPLYEESWDIADNYALTVQAWAKEAKRSNLILIVNPKRPPDHTLRQSYTDTGWRVVSRVQLGKRRGGLMQVLRLLRKAEEVQKGIRKVMRTFFSKWSWSCHVRSVHTTV
jgi:hypothetical protein